MAERKRCSRCGEEKPRTEEYFYRWSRSKDGLMSSCVLCVRIQCADYARRNSKKIVEKVTAWRRDHPDLAREYGRRWRAKNPGYFKAYYLKNRESALVKCREWAKNHRDQVRAYRKQYQLENIDRIKQRNREYYQREKVRIGQTTRVYRREHPEMAAESQRRWRWKHPDHSRSILRNRRARLRAAEGSHTETDIKRLWWFQKGRCQYCGCKLGQRFHVDHMVPTSREGSNWPKNLCLACLSCNSKKGNMTAEEFFAVLDRMESVG